jgi:hypothetical protein
MSQLQKNLNGANLTLISQNICGVKYWDFVCVCLFIILIPGGYNSGDYV